MMQSDQTLSPGPERVCCRRRVLLYITRLFPDSHRIWFTVLLCVLKSGWSGMKPAFLLPSAPHCMNLWCKLIINNWIISIQKNPKNIPVLLFQELTQWFLWCQVFLHWTGHSLLSLSDVPLSHSSRLWFINLVLDQNMSPQRASSLSASLAASSCDALGF